MQSFLGRCDRLRVMLCLFCCLPPCFQQCWAAGRSVGKHTDEMASSTGSGAVGGVALAWLQLFVNGDEGRRSVLADPGAAPRIASAFETNVCMSMS